MKSTTPRHQFRIRNVADNRFEYPQAGCRQFLIGLDGYVYDGNGNHYDENHIVNQWCGLTSYLDDLIYEGDIVEYYTGSGFSTNGPFKATVEFYNHGWCFRDENYEPLPIFAVEDIRVIGNIYDGIYGD